MSITERFLSVAEPDLGPLEEQYLLAAFRSGWISSLGEFIDRFESGFARLCGVRSAVAVSNGTAALHLALLAAGVRPDDEVIVPAFTFVATAAAVRHAGATPVFVESEPGIGTIDPKAVAMAITPRTKAIIPVHLFGHPADMDPILELSRTKRLVVIEDGAEAHGAKYKGRVVGSMGHMAIFSFYGNKIITTGEGGAVVTNDPILEERVRFLKDHAMDRHRRYWHPEIGFNYRMTNLQAAIGCAQTERFAELIAKRGRIIELYREVFLGTGLIINPSKAWAEPVPWLVTALLPDGVRRDDRDELIRQLGQKGIDSRPYFHLLTAMPPYAPFRRVGLNEGSPLPNSENISARGLILPSVTWLNEEDVSRVRKAIADFIGT
jgi:perosamine synthetase